MTTSLAEFKAAAAVRRVLTKLRVAQPEAFEALECEVFDAMEANLEGLGGMHEQMQTEVDKALEAARERVQKVLEQREADALAAERPRALMDEVIQLLEGVKANADALRSAAGLGAAGAGVAEPPPLEECDHILNLGEALAAEIKEGSQTCQQHAAEIKAFPNLPADMKKEWTLLANQIMQVRTRAQLEIASCKAAVARAHEGVRKKRFEEKKEELRKLLQDRFAGVASAEQHIITAERLVEPFIRGRRQTESEYEALAEQVEEARVTASEAVAAARQDLQESKVGDDVLSTIDDPTLKKQLEAFLASERKRPAVRIGQYERRVQRIVNIVKRFRKDCQVDRNKGLIEGLKAELLEKIKAAGDSTATVDNAEALLKVAEKDVEPCRKHKVLALAEMTELATTVSASLRAVQTAVKDANQELCPIDTSLDEDLQTQLKAAAAPLLRRHMLRLGQMERRITRVANLLATFEQEMAKKAENQHAPVKAQVLRVLRQHMTVQELGAEAVFESMGNVDKGGFLGFFAGLDKSVPKAGAKAGSEETESIDVSEDALEALIDSLIPDPSGEMKLEVFMQLACPVMHVVKSTSLTTEHTLAAGKMVRNLRVGELLEALEGPVWEERTNIMRVKIKTKSDDKVGWATVAGNAGTVFLKEGQP